MKKFNKDFIARLDCGVHFWLSTQQQGRFFLIHFERHLISSAFLRERDFVWFHKSQKSSSRTRWQRDMNEIYCFGDKDICCFSLN